jgi:FixJ family two-component response regulator
LDLAAKESGSIDILLTDVIMPGANGRELYESLRQLRPGLKVLFMSGYSADVISRHGVLENGIPFIHKPFTAGALARKLADILAGVDRNSVEPPQRPSVPEN